MEFDQFKFIFIENPKSGSSTILKGLEKALKIKINRGSPKQAHLTVDQVKNMYPDKWGYLKVTTQREPFQRFCSSINYEPHRLNHCFKLEQLQKHLKNPNGCVYCKPQSEFTKECDFIIDMNNSQSNFNDFCKTYKNEDRLYINYSLPYYINSSPLTSMYQIYQINRGFNIIKNYSLVNNIKYDIIIRTRLDVEFLHTFTPDLYDKTIKSKNTFFGRNWISEKTDPLTFDYYANNWVDDLYFHANFESFEKISSIYDEYYNLSIKHNTWISHILLYQFLKHNNITFAKSPITTRMMRDGGRWNQTLFNFE